jgi:predicted dehydrogenase
MNSDSSRIIEVAIAGQGRSGYSIHANCLRNLPGKYKIVAVADEVADRRTDAENEFGARAYADYKDLIKDGKYDLFVNALPSPLHKPATIEALEAGLDVVCEKPLAATTRDVDEMGAAAKKAGKLLAPFQNNRFQPFFDKMQEVIASGVLGKILHIRSYWGSFGRRWDWQTLQKNIGGSLYNTGPHSVDQALTLIGFDKTPQVFCRMSCDNPFAGDAEDLCALTLYGKDIPLVEIIISAYMAYRPPYSYLVCGTYGSMSGGAEKLEWKYFDPAKAPKHKMWNWSENRQYPSEKLDWIEDSWELEKERLKGASGYTLKSLAEGPTRFYNNIHDVLTGQDELIITLEQVRKQIAVIEESHRQNPLPIKG